MFRYAAVVLLLVGCSESSEPLEPAPPEPLPPRDNITGAYEGKLGAWDFRIRLTDDDGALSGSYAIRTSTTGEFENSGTLAGSATQRPNQALTQDVSLTLAGTLVGTFIRRRNGAVETGRNDRVPTGGRERRAAEARDHAHPIRLLAASPAFRRS